MNYEELELSVTWSVDDGYVNNGSHIITVKPSENFDEDEWNAMSDEEKDDYITDCVSNAFEQTVTYTVDDNGLNQ